MSCQHEKLKTRGDRLFCKTCGEELPIEFLTGGEPEKPENPSEMPVVPEIPGEIPQEEKKTRKSPTSKTTAKKAAKKEDKE